MKTRRAFIDWIRSLPPGTLFHTGDSSFCPLGLWLDGRFETATGRSWERCLARLVDNLGDENPDGSGRVTREQVLELVGAA